MSKKIIFLLFVLPIFYSLNAQEDKNLIAFYTFNNNTNNSVANALIKNNKGHFPGQTGFNELNKGVSFRENRFGVPNSAAYFNGKSYIQLRNFVTPDFMTISVWFKTSNYGDLFSKHDLDDYGFIFIVNKTGQLTFAASNDGKKWVDVRSKTTVNDGVWHHAAATFDGKTIKVYLDGELQEQDYLSGKLNNSSRHYANIGVRQLAYGYKPHYKGYMDDMYIYNKALSDTEIKKLFSNSSPPVITFHKPSKTYVEVNEQLFDLEFVITSQEELQKYEIKINDELFTDIKPTQKGSDYIFKKQIKLNLGTNHFWITAKNSGGEVFSGNRIVKYSSNKENTPNLDNNSSDIDKDIPITEKKKENAFALVIGNENYSKFQTGITTSADVEFAINDAKIFKEYLNKTIGIPNENIIELYDAQRYEMIREINKLITLAEIDDNIELYFYFAGHGLPHEESKEAFIMPVDITATDLEFAISLDKLYADFGNSNAKMVTIFLDACFSGGGRNEGLVPARAGVRLTPKTSDIEGNIVVFSASSSDQIALPFPEKKHGLFTYFILNALKESKGDISYSELADELIKNVQVKSILIHNSKQIPNVSTSKNLETNWKNIKF